MSSDDDVVDVPDAAVRGMVDALTEGWRVDGIDRVEAGTDFVAVLDVRTPGGPRRVVLKAVTAEWIDPTVARAEPRLLELVGRETSVPVPAVVGYRDDHEEFPSPFFLVEHVAGEQLDDGEHPAPERRERLVRAAGEHLGELHDLGPLSGPGTLGVRDGELTVLDADEFDDTRDWVLDHAEDALDSLTDGGYFPDLADEPERFADLVPDLREYVREALPSLPAPPRSTYCHDDYRYGNVVIDPDSGRPTAVLDWGNLSAAEPAYNLASAESLLLAPDRDDPERTDELRRTFREAYAGARDGWSFDDAVRERLAVYRLVCRLHAMACLPLWHQSAEERDRREGEHRAFVEQYL